MDDKKKLKTVEEDRFTEDRILEITVTVFVIAIVTFFFMKIVFF